MGLWVYESIDLKTNRPMTLWTHRPVKLLQTTRKKELNGYEALLLPHHFDMIIFSNLDDWLGGEDLYQFILYYESVE